MILAPPSLFGLMGRTRFFLLREGLLDELLLPLLLEEVEDLGKAKSPVLPFVPFSTSDMILPYDCVDWMVVAWAEGCGLRRSLFNK